MRQAIVILEDNEERIAEMRARLADKFPFFELAVFRTAPALLAWLHEHLGRAILISLDHDLEPVDARAGDPGTGRDAANYLVSQPSRCPVVLHTTNLPAAIAMETELAEAGWLVERITPYEDCTWIAEAWLPAVRRLIVGSARGAGRPAEGSTPASK